MSLFCRVTIKYKSAYASKINDKTTNKVYLPLFECEHVIKKLNEALGLHVKLT